MAVAMLVNCGCEPSTPPPAPTVSPSPATVTAPPPSDPSPPPSPVEPTQPIDALIDGPRPQAFEVAWAVWGDKELTDVYDATEFVRSALLNDGTLVWDDNVINQAVGDPNPARAGWLTIALRSPSRSVVLGLTDFASVSFTVQPDELAPWDGDRRWSDGELDRARRLLATDATASGLIWARWGNDGQGGGWITATAAIDDQLATSGTVANRTSGMPVERPPNNYRRKALRLLLALDGQPISLLLRETSYIATEPASMQLIRPGVPPPIPEVLNQSIITGRLADVGDIRSTLASVDGDHVFVLERGGTRLLKVRIATMQVVGELSGLDPIYTLMAYSADKASLFLAGSRGSANPRVTPVGGSGLLAEVDPATMSLRRRPVSVRCEPSLTLGALDANNLITFDRSGSINRINVASGVVTAKFASGADTARVHPDGRRVLTGGSISIECHAFDPVRNEAVGPVHTPYGVGLPARGSFCLLDNGRYLLTGSGTLARIGGNLERVVIGDRTLPVNSGAAVSLELGVLVVATSGGLRLLSWPELRPVAEHPCEGVLTDLSIHDGGRALVARFLPTATVDHFGTVSSPALAILVAIDLAALVPSGFIPDTAAPVAADAQAPLVRRLPLRTDITALAMPNAGNALYALDAAEGVALRIDPDTLDIMAASPRLPLSTTFLDIDPTGRWLIVAGSANPREQWDPGDRSWIIKLDPATLAPLGAPIDVADLISDIEALPNGRALVYASDPNVGAILEIDLVSGQQLARLRGFSRESTVTLSPDLVTLLVSPRDGGPLRCFRFGAGRGLESATEVPLDHDPTTWDAGQSWISSTGTYAIFAKGHLLSVQRRDLSTLGSLGHVLSAAGDESRVVLCTPDCLLNVVHFPSLRLSHSIRLDGPLTNLCFDHRNDRVFAVMRLGGSDEGGVRVNAVLGDVVSIDLRAIPAIPAP